MELLKFPQDYCGMNSLVNLGGTRSFDVFVRHEARESE